MGILDSLFNRKNLKAEKMNGTYFYYYNLFTNKVTEFSNSNAYILSKTVAEIYNPIDLIADRTSNIKYRLINKKTSEEVEMPLRMKMLMDKPNAYQTFSQFVYDVMFIKLAQGGVNVYRNTGDKPRKTVEYINSLWALQPDVTSIKLKDSITTNPFDITDLTDVVDSLTTVLLNKVKIPFEYIVPIVDNGINPVDFEYISPMNACERSINNLLQVYQARFNQYKNNGSAGILSRKVKSEGEMAQFDPVTRQDMIDELNKSDGVVDGKNFIGVSAIPMEFIKTLGTISELMPFEETKEDQLKIAGIYNISKHLLPMGESTTFSNQQDAERFFWQNTVKTEAYEMANILNKLFFVDTTKLTLEPVFDGIEVLQEDRVKSLEADIKEVELLAKLRELGINNKELEDKWNS